MSRRASKRDLVGKRITGVSFEEVKSIQTGQKVRHLVRLELDNGTRITSTTVRASSSMTLTSCSRSTSDSRRNMSSCSPSFVTPPKSAALVSTWPSWKRR